MKISKKDEKKLQELAEIVANVACSQINQISALVKTPTMQYKAQWVLEAVITILQCRV